MLFVKSVSLPTVILSLFLVTLTTKAALPIAYFKDKNSHFPSGQATLDRLSDNLIESTTTDAYYLAKEQKKVSPSLVPYITAFDLSRTWVEKYTRKKVPAKANMDLMQIILNYETDPYDMGLVQTLNQTHLKFEAHMKSKNISSIPGGESFIPISFDKGFVKVLFQKKFGYIDINDCISKFDFAKFAYSFKSRTKQWETVDHRQFDTLITIEKNALPLSHINGLVVDEKLAFVNKENPHYPKWTSFKIVKEKSDPWYKSRLDGHGIVWWQKNNDDILTQSISIDELIKKEVFSVSFQQGNPKKGIVSAHGVFITQDGQNWSELKEFKNYSGPVCYYNDKIIFIGDKRSLDGGKTFENYIDVSLISKAVHADIGLNPKKVKITKIKVQKPFNVLIDIDLGYRKIRLKSPIYAQEWTSAKL